jgi:hypothetical protein
MKHGRSVVVAAVLAIGAAGLTSSSSFAQSGWPGVACWGNNSTGQCNVPTGLNSVTAIAGGSYHTIALQSDGTVRCWGFNAFGQCNVPADLGTATAIAGGGLHSMALRSDGGVRCWGDISDGKCNVPADLGAASSIAGGYDHSLALRPNGSVRCWGDSSYGQCSVPVNLGVVTAIASGYYHSIALVNDGSVRCWGDNTHGQRNVPADLGATTAIAGGIYHTTALRSDGVVRCWGSNKHGECNVPTDLGTAIAIASGSSHTIALRSDGAVRCWGYNFGGACDVPANLGPATAISGGGIHTIAIPANYLAARAVSPTGSTAYVYASIQNATDYAPSGWIVEATSSATQSFNASNRFVRGLSNLDIPGSVTLQGASRVFAEGKLSIGSPFGFSPSTFESSFESVSEPGITFRTLQTAGIHTVASSPTRVIEPVDIRSDGGGIPDISTSHRLILDGGVFSSDPNGPPTYPDQIYARFETCTAPEFAAITPCLEFGPESIIDLPPGNKIISNGPTTTLVGGLATLRNGSTIETDADLAIGGSMRIPVGNAVSLSVDRVTLADPAIDIRAGGELVVEFGSSMQIAAPKKASVTGSLTVDQDALFSLLGGSDLLQVEPRGDARVFGGTIRSDEMILMGAPVGSPDAGGRLIGVNALIDVDTVRVRGGSANIANGSLVGNLVTEQRDGGSATTSTVAASGQVFGDISNTAGKVISIGDLIVVGDVSNSQGSQILAQVGVLYITGDLVNYGIVVGNVITAPGFQGGGTGGTQVGDGIRVAGSVEVGPEGQLRFIEDLWKFSVCGDMTLACAADDVRFNGAKLSLDGCEGTMQTFEATSADLGCVASAFSGEETTVSLIGELDVASGATVTLVDNFNNAPGKAAEVVYARGLTVQPGATLITNGIKVVTRNALIQGTVDDMSNICVVVDEPDPDVNGDGLVNGIDLAFILTYWGSSAPIADLNDDGIVGGPDLTIVLSGWTG